MIKFDKRSSRFSKWLDRWLGPPVLLAISYCCAFRRGGSLDSSKTKILVIKLSALGDFVVMLPALSFLKIQFPNSEIVFLSSKQLLEFTKHSGAIDRFEIFNRSGLSRLSREHFDIILDFEQWMRASAIASVMVPGTLRVGFRSEGMARHFGYDLKVDLDFSISMAENFFNLAASAVKKIHQDLLCTYQTARKLSQEHFLERIVELSPARDRKYFVLHPGCGETGQAREWPMENWLKLLMSLKSRYPNADFLVTGSGEYEKTLVQPLINAGCQSNLGELNQTELCGVLRGAEGVVTGNTGVMHLASLVKARLISLHGPTNLTLWAPVWDGKSIRSKAECSPCLKWGHDYGCDDAICMKLIRVSEVLESINA